MKHAKIRSRCLTGALALMVPGMAHGVSVVTVDFTAFGTQRNVITSTATPVADGNEVRLGIFGVDPFAIGDDLLALDSAFTPFATAGIDSVLTGTPGGFTGTDSHGDTTFDNKQAYLWVFKTVNDAPPAASYWNVEEHGIFTNPSMANWKIPAVGSVVPSTLVTSSEVSTAAAGAVLANSLQLSPVSAAAIPEASEMVLAAMMFSGCCLVRRRRGRRQNQRPGPGALGILLMAGALAITVPAAQAVVTINYVGQLGQRNVVDEAGAAIPDQGGEVRVGILAPTYDVTAHANDLQRLREAFTTVGVTAIRTVQNEPSRFSVETSFENPELFGEKLYLWVIKTTDGGPVAPDYSNVAEYALYSSSAAHWAVPPDTTAGALPPANRTIINSSEIDELWGSAGVLDNPAPGSLQITSVSLPWLDYASYAAAIFPAGASSERTGAGADYDGDGLANAVEMFTGNNPLQVDVTPFEFSTDHHGRFLFTFNRSLAVDAGAGVLEFSEDLAHWFYAGGDLAVLGSDGLVERVQAAFAGGEFDRFFLRVAVDHDPAE